MTLRHSMLAAAFISCLCCATRVMAENVVAERMPCAIRCSPLPRVQTTSFVLNSPSQADNRSYGDCDLVVPGRQAGVDLLQYTPRLRGTDYAALDYGNALWLGTGSIQRLAYNDSAGYRAGVGYLMRMGWGVSVQMASIDFSGFDQVDRPTGSGQLFARERIPTAIKKAKQRPPREPWISSTST